MKKHFYITTTLPYVNAKPHIGHALEFIQADVIARYQRQQGKDVQFNVGTDEHGLKIFQTAQKEKKDIKEFVRINAETFSKFCEHFNISYTNFYRTSSPEHIHVAQTLREQCKANGDIYEKQYTGLYCVGCESFKTSKELVDGKCPDHNTKPIEYNEKNYFFRLSKYKKELLSHIKSKKTTTPNTTSSKKDFIIPPHKANELANFVEDIQDISISRRKENLPRGVPVPGDDTQVMYVRFDALSNYIGAVGYATDPEKFETYRGTKDKPNTVQICGPDNLRFQGAIRQGMLASAGLPLSKTLLIHGMVFGPDGNKMSKTLGNIIDPMDQLDKFGVDAVRYYIIAGIPTFGDASYRETDLINLYNSHLANSFGNLLNRVIHLANKKEIILTHGHISEEIQNIIEEYQTKIDNSYRTFNLYDAASHIHNLALFANEYISTPGQEPRNKEVSPEQAEQTLVDTSAMLSTIINGYEPILPNKCKEARQKLKQQEKGILFNKLQETT